MDLRAHHKPTFDNISAEKRSRILDAATNEFAVKGFENGNIGTIAKKAGVSVGSLYKYFENKQDLFSDRRSAQHFADGGAFKRTRRKR